MIRMSKFLQNAVQKPWYFYFSQLFLISPMNCIGLVAFIDHDRKSTQFEYIVFTIWPLCFLFGFTILGCLGAGFQTRFILPMIPATTILSALQLSRRTVPAYCMIFLLICGIHSMFYGIMFPTLFADIDYSVLSIISSIKQSSYYSPSSREEMQTIFRFMKHYGLIHQS